MSSKLYSGCLLGLFIILFHCCSTPPKNDTSLEKPIHLNLKYARHFNVKSLSHNRTKVIIHAPWSESSMDLTREFLIDSGKVAKSIVCLSPTHVMLLNEMGLKDRISGIPSYNDIFDEELKRYFFNRKIKEVGNVNNLNYELLIELSPDLIIESAVGNSLDVNQKLTELNLPVILFSAHVENHPMGRLEWCKYLSLFTGSLQETRKFFEEKNRGYVTAQQSANVENRPKVFAGYRWKDNWYIPGGKSYMARFIADAGGEHLLREDPNSGNIRMGHEKVIELLEGCDIWLHPGYQINSLDELDDLNIPKKYFEQGLKVYNNNKRLNAFQKNDFWQSGYVNPHLVLKDLSNIFKGTSDSLYFYKKVQVSD